MRKGEICIKGTRRHTRVEDEQSTLIHGMCLFGASSRNGGEHLSAKLDEQYKRLRRVVA